MWFSRDKFQVYSLFPSCGIKLGHQAWHQVLLLIFLIHLAEFAFWGAGAAETRFLYVSLTVLELTGLELTEV